MPLAAKRKQFVSSQRAVARQVEEVRKHARETSGRISGTRKDQMKSLLESGQSGHLDESGQSGLLGHGMCTISQVNPVSTLCHKMFWHRGAILGTQRPDWR